MVNHIDITTSTSKHVLTFDELADIHYKNEYGHGHLHLACMQDFTSIIPLLIAKGSDINAISHHGNTPLHIACSVGFEDIVHILLEMGADPNIANVHGDTPLHDVCKKGASIEGSYFQSLRRTEMYSVIAKLLIKFGADCKAINSNGLSPNQEAERLGYDDITNIFKFIQYN